MQREELTTQKVDQMLAEISGAVNAWPYGTAARFVEAIADAMSEHSFGGKTSLNMDAFRADLLYALYRDSKRRDAEER